MDHLNQTKLTKAEWDSIEIPIRESEKEVLSILIQGYSNVSISVNNTHTLYTLLKLKYLDTSIEEFIFTNYCNPRIVSIISLFDSKRGPVAERKLLVITFPKTKVTLKKSDAIRIEHSTNKLDGAFEYVLIDILHKLIALKLNGNVQWIQHYFTLFKLFRYNIQHVNAHLSRIIDSILNEYHAQISTSHLIENSVDYIEKNELLLRYADISLYDHQRELYTILRDVDPVENSITPKLILYIAPTGTGKTLSPIGLSQNYKVIYICASRHVGLSMARSAISMNKRIAFAFGCTCTADIRLHYFSAKIFTKDWFSGKIRAIDNSAGDKVEIMICDLTSYLYAMMYMKSFFPLKDIIMYWDEPTIGMDVVEHPLHTLIRNNWTENKVPTIILSSATLPKAHELTPMIDDLRAKDFRTEDYTVLQPLQVHVIESHECKKTIALIDNRGYAMTPHALCDNYDGILTMSRHCRSNLTLLRYLDLTEVIRFIIYVERRQLIPEELYMDNAFATLDDVNMMSIKIHYLRLLENIRTPWPTIFEHLRECRNKRISTESFETKKVATASASSSPNTAGVYITTRDSYTLTDGPTLFLTNNVEKVVNFYIQESNIPIKVIDTIMETLTINNAITDRIDVLDKKYEDITGSNESVADNYDDVKSAGGGGCGSRKKSSKKTKDVKIKDDDTEGGVGKGVVEILSELERLRAQIRPASLNETFVPNKPGHMQKWAACKIGLVNAFSCNIDEEIVSRIMAIPKIQDEWKILLMMGIGIFSENEKNPAYREVMKELADDQKLFIIIASSDHIYGTNYQFCHGYLSKDLVLTQEKLVQALGRIGRYSIQQDYTIRVRDEKHFQVLFYPEYNKREVINMNILLNSKRLIHDIETGTYTELEPEVEPLQEEEEELEEELEQELELEQEQEQELEEELEQELEQELELPVVIPRNYGRFDRDEYSSSSDDEAEFA
jgi:hypothetical protein